MFLKKDSPRLLALLAFFVALGPLSTDMYLPALPAMVAAFDTEIPRLQLTLSAYLVGFSVFHLFCGPLSDRFGRKPVLLIGFIIFSVASVGCATADSVEELMLWRFVQGIGACVGPTLARAMVRDIYGPLKAVKALASMGAIMALAPVIAPILGGWMLLFGQWPIIFIFLACYAVLAIVLLLGKLPESLPVAQSIHPRAIVKNYWFLINDFNFRTHVLAASFLYAGAFAFIAGSSYILIGFMHVAPENFGYWFMLIVVGYFSGSIFTARFSHLYKPSQLMAGGALLGLLASIIMIGLYLSNIYHPLTLVLPVALYTCAVGVAMPQAIASALAPFPNMAGTASALMGFCQMSAAALATAIVGITLTGEPMPLALTLSGCSILSLAFFWRLINNN